MFSKFLLRAKDKHGDRYTYVEESYSKIKAHVRIVCTIHGEFLQVAADHLKGRGCPLCAKIQVRKTFDVFEKQALAKHGDRYTYHRGEYSGSQNKTRITCAEHGDFWQNAYQHVSGTGCPTCGNKIVSNRGNVKDFVVRANAVHDGKYTYVEESFDKTNGLIKIICPEHGEFTQLGGNHLQGSECPKCGEIEKRLKLTKTFEIFVKEANAVHADRYTYAEESYKKANSQVEIVCPDHGSFTQQASSHLKGFGCRKCAAAGSSSKWEKEIQDFLAPYLPENNYRLKLEGDLVRKPGYDLSTYTELDLYFPKHNLAVEAHGTYWHDELHVGKHYHSDKLKACNARGLDLIQVYEDEWQTKQSIVKSIVLTRLGTYERKIPARKTITVLVSASVARKFYDENHIQGYANCELHRALTLDGEIVAMASFGKRKHLFNSDTQELVRFCTLLNTQIIGGLSKLTKGFKKLRTYCDLRLFNGKGYKIAGFKEISVTPPGYYYVKNNVRYSRFMFQKHKLADRLPDFDPELSEIENMGRNGYTRIFNCGNMVLERVDAQFSEEDNHDLI